MASSSQVCSEPLLAVLCAMNHLVSLIAALTRVVSVTLITCTPSTKWICSGPDAGTSKHWLLLFCLVYSGGNTAFTRLHKTAALGAAADDLSQLMGRTAAAAPSHCRRMSPALLVHLLLLLKLLLLRCQPGTG